MNKLTESEAIQFRAALIKKARSVLWTPYTKEPSYPAFEEPLPERPVAFNCSGYTYWVYAMCGMEIPKKQSPGGSSQYDLVHELGNWRTDVDELSPGDLCFYKIAGDPRGSGHVAMYYGSRQVIHDYGANGVCITPYDYIGTFIGGGAPFVTIPDPPKEVDVKPCIFHITDHNIMAYFDWHDMHDLTEPETLRVVREIYKKVHGEELPMIPINGAEFARVAQAFLSGWPKPLEKLANAFPRRSPADD